MLQMDSSCQTLEYLPKSYQISTFLKSHLNHKTNFASTHEKLMPSVTFAQLQKEPFCLAGERVSRT